MQKVLITHIPEVFAEALAKRLQPRYDVHICPEDTDMLWQIEQLRPDILVVYLRIPPRNGINLLKETRFKPPVVLALTNVATEAVCREAAAVGISELLTIPCKVDHVTKRLEALLNEKIPSPEI